MCGHSTKRLYFPDAVEPDTQYDKYPIVSLPPIGDITIVFDPDTLIKQYNNWVKQNRDAYGF